LAIEQEHRLAVASAGEDAARCLACHGPLNPTPALTAQDKLHRVPGEWAVRVCARCGSGVTVPPVEESELAAFYPDRYAPYELPQGPLARAMRIVQRARDRSFPLSALRDRRAPGRLLDVGCGRGDLAASWIEAGWEVLGVEPSADAAEVARGRGAEVREGTLTTVRLEPQSVDAAVFRHSLEHVPDPQRDLRLVHDALRPSGRLAVIVPNWASWQRRVFGESWAPLELPRHRTHFTPAGLQEALAAAGFTRIDVRPGTPLITTTWSIQLRLFGRCLTQDGAPLIAGYIASVPVALATRALDLLLRDGDFLHAAAERAA
jgi:SAM-dependent methyltransferase